MTSTTSPMPEGATLAGVATSGPWHRWLLIAALALGVLAMHHLPDAPQRAGSTAVMAMTPTLTTTSTEASETHGDQLAEPASGEGCPGMDMMGHLCLAVFDASSAHPAPPLAVAAPALLPGSPATPTPWASALEARAPPPTVSTRLSRLGVWRR